MPQTQRSTYVALNWIAAVLCTLTLLLLAAASLYAQPVNPPVPVATALGPDNPLPAGDVDAIATLQTIINLFASAWYLGVAVVLFLVVAFLRGKLMLGSWRVRIPKVSDWLVDKGAKYNFWFIVVLVGLGFAFAALGTLSEWGAWEVVRVMVSGFVSGVVLALAAMGVKKGIDVHKEAPPPTLLVGSVVSIADTKYKVATGPNGTFVLGPGE